MEYKGFRYEVYEDVEPEECVKLFHTCVTPTDERYDIPFSPYFEPKLADFAAWVNLGCPDQKTVRACLGTGNIGSSRDFARLHKLLVA